MKIDDKLETTETAAVVLPTGEVAKTAMVRLVQASASFFSHRCCLALFSIPNVCDVFFLASFLLSLSLSFSFHCFARS